MLGLGLPELLILLAVLVVLLLAVRVMSRTPKAASAPVTVAVDASLQSRIRALVAADQRISAIKLLRQETRLGLLDAKNAVDAIAAGHVLPTPSFGAPSPAPPYSAGPGRDLAYRARSLAAAGREDEAVRLVTVETGMSAPEARVFVRALNP